MYLKHMRPYQLKAAVAVNQPLLVPAGCIATHGPHMAIGHDTIIVEEICARIAERVDIVIAPSFDYGPTMWALGGPADGTIDPDYDGFHRLVKSVLRNFLEMGFKRVVVIIMHQGMEGPRPSHSRRLPRSSLASRYFRTTRAAGGQTRCSATNGMVSGESRSSQ